MASALLIATVTAASAKTYNIAITNTCDTLTLTETDGVVVGVSNATNGCDDSYEIGSAAKLAASVTPGGKVLVAAGDLGSAPTQWVWEFNLKTGEAELRGTPDGSTVYALEFPFTTGKVLGDRSHLPKATTLFKQSAKPVLR
jgi:hypothetical protein